MAVNELEETPVRDWMWAWIDSITQFIEPYGLKLTVLKGKMTDDVVTCTLKNMEGDDIASIKLNTYHDESAFLIWTDPSCDHIPCCVSCQTTAQIFQWLRNDCFPQLNITHDSESAHHDVTVPQTDDGIGSDDSKLDEVQTAVAIVRIRELMRRVKRIQDDMHDVEGVLPVGADGSYDRTADICKEQLSGVLSSLRVMEGTLENLHRR